MAFGHFYADLKDHGPGGTSQLLTKAREVQQAASDDADFGDVEAASFLEDANALLAYVQRPSFAASGSASADPVQEMVDDCL